MSLLWELQQNRNISEANSSAQDSAATAGRAVERVKELEARVDRLTLVCRALWTFLQQEHGLTEAQLDQRVTELDLLDGVIDGKVQRRAKKCPLCQRMMSPRHNRCLYCGGVDLTEGVFDSL